MVKSKGITQKEKMRLVCLVQKQEKKVKEDSNSILTLLAQMGGSYE